MKQIKKIANRCMLYNNTDEFCLFSNTRSSYILCMDSLAVIDTNVKDVRYYLFDSKICYMSASENEFYKFNIEKEELLFLGWSKPLSYGMGYELINLAEFVIGISESYSKKMILINKKTNEIISSENCPPKYSISKGCKYDEETLFIMMISPVSWRLLNRYFKVKMNDIDYYEEIELNMEEQVWDKCFYLKSKKYFMFIEDNRFYIYSEIEKKMIYYSPNFENSFISLTHFLDEKDMIFYFKAKENMLFEFDLNSFQLRYVILPKCVDAGIAISKKYHRLLFTSVENDKDNIYVYDFDFQFEDFYTE